MDTGRELEQCLSQSVYRVSRCQNVSLYIFLKILLIFFSERGREGEREGEKHQCVVASHVAPTGDLTCNPGMCPDWELNRRHFGSQPMLDPLSYTSQAVCINSESFV